MADERMKNHKNKVLEVGMSIRELYLMQRNDGMTNEDFIKAVGGALYAFLAECDREDLAIKVVDVMKEVG